MTDTVDCHVHWFPPAYYELLAARSSEPRAERAGDGWTYLNGSRTIHEMGADWFDLERLFETADATASASTIVSSLGVHSDLDGLPPAEAREAARLINEAWSQAQRDHPGRFLAAAAVPLQDVGAAIDELEHAIGTLDLRGVSMPGSIDGAPIDAPELAPFYARVEQLGVPLLIHPNDGLLVDVMSGYDKRLYASLGRVVDSSVAVLRLILSGILDRHPSLKILHFHAGGVLPYAAGRLDKNASIASIERSPSEYLKEMWVDTAMPQALTIRMAREFYGPERVLYGSDNPCWTPSAAMDAVDELVLDEPARGDLLGANARRLMRLDAPA